MRSMHQLCAAQPLKRNKPALGVRSLELTIPAISELDAGLAPRLSPRIFRKSNATRIGDGLETRGDVNGIAHEVAVLLDHDVAKVDTDAKLHALRGWDARIARCHALLKRDCTAHCVDRRTEFDQDAVAHSFDNTSAIFVDYPIDNVAANCT